MTKDGRTQCSAVTRPYARRVRVTAVFSDFGAYRRARDVSSIFLVSGYLPDTTALLSWLQQGADQPAPGVVLQLLLPLDEENVRQRSAQTAGQRRRVEPVIDFEVNRLRAEQPRPREERKCD